MTNQTTAAQWDTMKLFVRTLISRSDIGGQTRIGLFVFTDSIRRSSIIDLGDFNSRQEMYRALDMVPYIPHAGPTLEGIALNQLLTMFMATPPRANITRHSFIGLTPHVTMPTALTVMETMAANNLTLNILAVGFAKDDVGRLYVYNSTASIWRVPNYVVLGEIVIPNMFRSSKCGKLYKLVSIFVAKFNIHKK